MDWVSRRDDRVYGLDTAPLIYYIEEHHRYLEFVESLFNAAESGRITIVTSTITMIEVLTQPYRVGHDEIAKNYRESLQASQLIRMVPVTDQIADKSAVLRARYGLRTPDAIQIATAIVQNATVFVTNDKQFRTISEIEVVILEDLEIGV